MTSLRGKRILLVEAQPLVAADIEDRLLDAGVDSVSIVGKPDPDIALAGYDALIINATQNRELARGLVTNGSGGESAVVVLHDDATRARAIFPRATIVEIPFDSEAVREAVIEALGLR
jgi:hypothetical protein